MAICNRTSDAGERRAGPGLVRAHFVCRARDSLPPSGDWAGTLSGSGKADYFWFVAQSDRTLSVEATALDECQSCLAGKSSARHRHVGAGGPGTFPRPPTPAWPLTAAKLGMTRLDATLQIQHSFSAGSLRLPRRRTSRLPLSRRGSSTLTTRLPGARPRGRRHSDHGAGNGFPEQYRRHIAAANAPVLAAAANHVIAAAPAMADGMQQHGVEQIPLQVRPRP